METSNIKPDISEEQPPVKESAYWINHQGRPVLLHDYSSLVGPEIVERMTALREEVVSRGVYDLLLLVNVMETVADRAVIATSKETLLKLKPFIRKTAVIGAFGVTKHFVNVVDQVAQVGIRIFDSQDEALDWLVED